MLFSFTYQNFRLLDVKALTECHLYAMAQPSGSIQSQTVNSSQDYRQLCKVLFDFFRMLSLGCFYTLFSLVVTEEYIVPVSADALLEVDLEDFLKFIKNIGMHNFSTDKEEQLKTSIDGSSNGVLEFTTGIKELSNKPSELLNTLCNEKNKDLYSVVADELRVRLQDSYEEIIFNGVSVLRIYAEHVTSIFEAIKNTAGIKIKDAYDSNFQQACLESITDLSFDQVKNWNTIYASYIVSICAVAQKATIINRYNELSCGGISALSNSEGDAIYTIDKPVTSGILVNNIPEASIKPGMLLYQVNKLEKDCELTSNRKSEVLSNTLAAFEFNYSNRAGHKYLIKSTKDDTMFWIYNQNNLKEPTFPLYSIISAVIKSELEEKAIYLNAIFKNVYKFNICLPSDICTNPRLKAADNTSLAKQTADSFHKIVDSLMNSIPNYLAADSIMSNLGITDIFQYNTYVKLINELLILDANLKTVHSSLSKFWSIYLAANFSRDKTATFEISDALIYVNKYITFIGTELHNMNLVYPYTKNIVANFTALMNAISINDNYAQVDTTIEYEIESLFIPALSQFDSFDNRYDKLLNTLGNWKVFSDDMYSISEVVSWLEHLTYLVTVEDKISKEILLYSAIILTLTKKQLQYLANEFCDILGMPAENMTDNRIFSFCLKTLFYLLNSPNKKEQLRIIFLLLYENKLKIDFCSNDVLSMDIVKVMDISSFLDRSSLKSDVDDLLYNLVTIYKFLKLDKVKDILSLAESISNASDKLALELLLLKFNRDKKFKANEQALTLNLDEAVSSIEALLVTNFSCNKSLIDKVSLIFSKPDFEFNFEDDCLFNYMIYSIFQFEKAITEYDFKAYLQSIINKELYTRDSYRPNIHVKQEDYVFDELIKNLAYVLVEYEDIANYIRTQLNEPHTTDLYNIKSAKNFTELDDKYSLFCLSKNLDEEGNRELEFTTVVLADITVNYYLHSSGAYVCGSRIAASYEDYVDLLTSKVRQISNRDIETGIVITKETLKILKDKGINSDE